MRALPAALLLFLTVPVTRADAQRRPPTDTLAWQAGCRQGTRGSSTIEEQWMAPRGGMLFGVGRKVACAGS